MSGVLIKKLYPADTEYDCSSGLSRVFQGISRVQREMVTDEGSEIPIHIVVFDDGYEIGNEEYLERLDEAGIDPDEIRVEYVETQEPTVN